jgi:hypothetical protein
MSAPYPDLVKRLRIPNAYCGPKFDRAIVEPLKRQAADRIEALEAAAQETALELIAAHGQAGDALDRAAKLEAAIIAALRAPDEASTREILRKARDGE